MDGLFLWRKQLSQGKDGKDYFIVQSVNDKRAINETLPMTIEQLKVWVDNKLSTKQERNDAE